MDTTLIQKVFTMAEQEKQDTRAARMQLDRILAAVEEARAIFEVNRDTWALLWLRKYPREGGTL